VLLALRSFVSNGERKTTTNHTNLTNDTNKEEAKRCQSPNFLVKKGD
jgi:hypothetical protein